MAIRISQRLLRAGFAVSHDPDVLAGAEREGGRAGPGVVTCSAIICPSSCDRLTRRAKFQFTKTPNQWLYPAIPFRQEGRSRVVTNAGWDVVDATASARMASQGEMNLVSDLSARRTNDVVAYGKSVWS